MLLVFLFLAMSSLFISRVLYRTYLSPIGIFGLIWNGALALFEARLIDYYPLSIEAYIAFIGSFVLFVFGALVSTWPLVQLMQRSPISAYKSPFAMVLNPRRARQVLNILNLLSLVGLMLTTITFAQLVGWGALFDMSRVRDVMRNLEATEKLGGGIVGYLSSLLPLAAILGGVYLVQAPSDWFRASLCLFISLGQVVISGSRSSFIWASVLFFTAYILTRTFVKRESLGRMIRPLLIGMVIFFVVFSSIGSRRFDTANYDVFFANVELPWSIMHAYSYFTAGFGAFSIHLDDPIYISVPGLHTLSPVVRMLARIDPGLVNGYSYATLLNYTVSRESVATPTRTNVYTYLGALFDDFNWWGVFLTPLSMGILSGLVFYRLLVRSDFGTIGLYSLFCLQCVYSSMAIITHANAILLSAFVLMAIRKYVSQQGRKCLKSAVCY